MPTDHSQDTRNVTKATKGTSPRAGGGRRVTSTINTTDSTHYRESDHGLTSGYSTITCSSLMNTSMSPSLPPTIMSSCLNMKVRFMQRPQRKVRSIPVPLSRLTQSFHGWLLTIMAFSLPKITVSRLSSEDRTCGKWARGTLVTQHSRLTNKNDIER